MKRVIGILSALIISTFTAVLITVSVSAGPAYIDLQNVRKNQVGDGYHWSNTEDVLTIDGLNINTDCDYGIKLPEKCTVEIYGTNTIKAGKYGVGCFSDVTFKGTGSLTVEAGDTALYFYSSNENHKLLIREGTYSFTAPNYGIYATSASVSITGGSVTVNSENVAVEAPNVSLVGGDFTAVGTVKAGNVLRVSGLNLDVKANGDGEAALSGGSLEIDQVKIYSEKGGEEAEEYSGTATVYMTADVNSRSSVIFSKLFGREDIKAVWDYVICAVAVVILCAAVEIPIFVKKRKTAKMLETLDDKYKKLKINSN